MAGHCKGICGPIASKQKTLKKELFKGRQKGSRPINMNISVISKYCKTCDVRFYLVDYLYCKCCGCKLRSRNVYKSLGDLDKDRSKWSLLGAVAPQTSAAPTL